MIQAKKKNDTRYSKNLTQLCLTEQQTKITFKKLLEVNEGKKEKFQLLNQKKKIQNHNLIKKQKNKTYILNAKTKVKIKNTN